VSGPNHNIEYVLTYNTLLQDIWNNAIQEMEKYLVGFQRHDVPSLESYQDTEYVYSLIQLETSILYMLHEQNFVRISFQLKTTQAWYS